VGAITYDSDMPSAAYVLWLVLHARPRYVCTPDPKIHSEGTATAVLAEPTTGGFDLNSAFGPLSERVQTDDLSPVVFWFAGTILLTGCHQPVPFADSSEGAFGLQQGSD
jgi:hypothetical protein